MILIIIGLIILQGLIYLVASDHVSLSYTNSKTGKKRDLNFVLMIVIIIILLYLLKFLK